MNLEKLLKEVFIDEISEMMGNDEVKEKAKEKPVFGYQVGKNYFIRTVTHYLVGRLVHVTDKELILDNCSWIADTGRYHKAFINGDFSEKEPYPKDLLVHVNRGAFIDAAIWEHKLPTESEWTQHYLELDI